MSDVKQDVDQGITAAVVMGQPIDRQAAAAAEPAAIPAPQPTLIRNGELQVDTWRRFTPSDDQKLPADNGDWLVPLTVWLEAHAQLRTRQHPVGIFLQPADEPLELADHGAFDATGVALIAIDFPQYTDGRGYSIAQILRTRLKYAGELRAVGDVMIDTIHYQARCGFDSFLLKPGHRPEEALAAFNAFTVHYQQTYPKPRQVA
jgi:uncharacterized protein (DUF934 family)